MWTVVFYTDDRGRKPVRDFLDSITNEDRARFQAVLENHIFPRGTNVRHEILHRVEEFYQFRFIGCRVLMYLPADETETFVLLHAFKKKSPRTPKGDITRARNNKADDERQRTQARRGNK